ncbi:MAG TPA: hypothetical protein VHN80_07975, partial [Kineosporiaceae bacterium]|nr:hypothetical protein [Kineosporiaceae bacterium]
RSDVGVGQGRVERAAVTRSEHDRRSGAVHVGAMATAGGAALHPSVRGVADRQSLGGLAGALGHAVADTTRRHTRGRARRLPR